MPPAADGPSGSTIPPIVLEWARDTSPLDHALDVIERELALTQGNVEAVAAACAEVGRGRAAWSFAPVAQRLRALAHPVTTGSSGVRQPIVDLLYDVADASDDPWSILAALLESHDRSICDGTLERLRQLVEAGRLRIDERLLTGLGRLVESGPICCERDPPSSRSAACSEALPAEPPPTPR